MHAGLQVDMLKLTVERLGSASKGLCSGAYGNLESLTVTHITREDDVQVRFWPAAGHGLPAGRGRLWPAVIGVEALMGLPCLVEGQS